ncbi:MAG: hypothetical protein HUJ26_21510 [Planctomycetaceae bacterium]|nr:hypothetical protein [Planctomycetaceae bacterium]
MRKTLIVGMETLSGRYLSQAFSRSQSVLGVSLSGGQLPRHGDAGPLYPISEAAAIEFLKHEEIERVIYCGEASQSSWTPELKESRFCSDTQVLVMWSRVCETCSTSFVFLTADSIFDGPWMFHAEESQSFTETPWAHTVRAQEEIVSYNERALIVRSHLLGFAPESLLTTHLFPSATIPFSSEFSVTQHATPLYAGRFARMLEDLLDAEPVGLLHLGGGERISRTAFLSQLEDRFGRCVNSPTLGEEKIVPCRETSLRSSRAKPLLKEGLPGIEDLLDDIAADLESGVAAHFSEVSVDRHQQVA